MSDYCFYPNQCGVGMDCSPCLQRRIEQLESQLAAAESTIEDQLDTIKALTEGTDGSTPAIVTIGRLQDALDAERDRVRMLREALEYAVNQVPEMGTVPGVTAALATTAPEAGEDGK